MDKNIIGQNPIMRFGRQEIGTPIATEYFGSNNWISFGKENDFPQELIRLYQNASTLHTTLIDRKVDMTCSNGFETQTPFILNEYSKDDLNVIARKVAYDEFIFNGFYLNIIFSKDGKSVSQIEHLPYEKVRVAKCDTENDEIPGFWISKDWTNKNKKGNKPTFLPEYSEDLDTKEFPSQVIFFKTYCPGLDYYTLPSYHSSLNWVKLDYEISTYHLKNVQNGLMPGMIIVNKSGIPTAEERRQIYDETKQHLAGADNAGDFIMVYAESADKAPEFIPVQLNSSDQRFKDLMEQIDNTIMRMHKFTSAVAGIETAGKLGSSQEITEQLMMIQNTVITPIQFKIEMAFNKIAKISGSDEVVKLKKYIIFDEKTVETAQSIEEGIQKIRIV